MGVSFFQHPSSAGFLNAFIKEHPLPREREVELRQTVQKGAEEHLEIVTSKTQEGIWSSTKGMNTETADHPESQ